ncbi:MAG: hypothetical protein ACI909_003370 [Planctomycetota bacterium]|jgi:hypothetical protein
MEDAQTLYSYISQRGLNTGEGSKSEQVGVFEGIGKANVAQLKENVALLSFAGEIAASILSLMFSPRRIRWKIVLREL